jgi:hypothetical protein
MKKAIFAIAALAILTVGNSFAQYSSKGHNGPVYASNSRTNNTIDQYQVGRLDHIVGLSRSQEAEIKRIEDYYARVIRSTKKSQTYESLNRLESQKQHDILEVLTSVQRRKLMAYEKSQKYDGRDKFSNRSRRG